MLFIGTVNLFFKFFCPGNEAALWIIVVSLPYTSYLCGAFIAF